MCGLCLRVKASKVSCVQCGKWIDGRCAGVRMVIPKLLKNFLPGTVMRILERQWSTKKRYVVIWKQYKFTYVGTRVSAGGECQASLSA